MIEFITQFQALVSALIALISALLATFIIFRGQNRADIRHREDLEHRDSALREEHDRKRKSSQLSMASRISHIRRLCRQHQATIKVTAVPKGDGSTRLVSEDTKQRLMLPDFADKDDWIAIQAFDAETIKVAQKLATEILFHNWNTSKVDTYAQDNVRTDAIHRLSEISRLATNLLNACVNE